MAKSMELFKKNHAMLLATTRQNLTSDSNQSLCFQDCDKNMAFSSDEKHHKKPNTFNIKPTPQYHHYFLEVGNYPLTFLYT